MVLIHSFNYNLSSVKDNDDLGSTSGLFFLLILKTFSKWSNLNADHEKRLLKKKASYVNLVLSFHQVV